MSRTSIPLYDLGHEEFQTLVFRICKHILGATTELPSEGRDDGIDAYYVGIPEKIKDWRGKVVVQAKHTGNQNASMADSDFVSYNGKSGTINKEVLKIKKLVDDNLLDYYILFSNRRNPARTVRRIRKYISLKCGIPEDNIKIFGVEEICEFIRDYPEVNDFSYPSIKSVVNFSPQDIEDIIEEIDRQFVVGDLKNNIDKEMFNKKRLSLEKKNKYNNINVQQEMCLLKYEIPNDSTIKEFLADPANKEMQMKYENCVAEIQGYFASVMDDGNYAFMKVISTVFKALKEKSSIIRRNVLKTYAILYYMYCNCDIGKDYVENNEI